MKCVKCGSEMLLDDEDYSFKGCTDKIYRCPNCNSISGIRKIRYGKCVLEEQYEYNYDTDEEKVIYSHNPSLLDGSEF